MKIMDRKLTVIKSDSGSAPFAPIIELDLSEFSTIDELFIALIATGLFGTGEETDGTASQAKFFGVLPLQLDELRG